MDTILNVTFPRSLFTQVFGATMVGSPCLKDPTREGGRVKLYLPKCCYAHSVQKVWTHSPPSINNPTMKHDENNLSTAPNT